MPRRKAEDAAGSALTKALRGLFRALESRPLPDRLRSVVDQLDEPGEGGDQQDRAGGTAMRRGKPGSRKP